jgi:hypothetical protein
MLYMQEIKINKSRGLKYFIIRVITTNLTKHITPNKYQTQVLLQMVKIEIQIMTLIKNRKN